jgi:hypothetical protein
MGEVDDEAQNGAELLIGNKIEYLQCPTAHQQPKNKTGIIEQEAPKEMLGTDTSLSHIL